MAWACCAGVDARAAEAPEQLTPASKSVAGEAHRLSDNAAAPLVVVAAGGTGGHLFPAGSLERRAIESAARSLISQRMSGRLRYGAAFPAAQRTSFRVRRCAGTIRGPTSRRRCRSYKVYCRAGHTLAPAAACSSNWLWRLCPTVPVLSACWLGVPTLIHEQNGVL